MSPPHCEVIELGDPRWTRFVAGRAERTPFHEPAWAQLLSVAYHWRAFAVAICTRGGQISAGAPFLELRGLTGRRTWVSLPFTDECLPLAESEGARAALEAALVALGRARRAPRLELRAETRGAGWQTSATAVIHELELASAEQLRGRLHRSQVVRNIARAEREGVAVRTARRSEDLAAFYALHVRTRRRQGVPVQPRRFFELVWSELVEPGRASILLASVDGRAPLAGALFLHGHGGGTGTTIYKFGASDPAGRALRPNHLIFWTAMREAYARGDRRFDLGRTDLAHHSLRAFKRGWGTQERPLRYATLDSAAWDDGGMAGKALGGLIQHTPPWVCRAAGTLLYRFAGSR